MKLKSAQQTGRTFLKSLMLGTSIILGGNLTAVSPVMTPAAYAASQPSKPAYKSFLKAARKNDIEKLEKYIAKYPTLDMNYQDRKGATALFLAAQYGSLDAARYLIAQGANPNVVDNTGASPLMHVTGTSWKNSNADRLSFVDLLLENGAKTEFTSNSHGSTALMFAAGNHSPQMVTRLIEAGANANHAAKNGNTSLMNAVAKRSFLGNSPIVGTRADTVKVLLAGGADPKIKNSIGENVISFAVKKTSGTELVNIFEAIQQSGHDLRLITKDGFNARDITAFAATNSLSADLTAWFERNGISHTAGFQKELETIQAEKRQKLAEQEALRNPRAPLPCQKTVYKGMSESEGEAVKYLIEQRKEGLVGRRFCIESITANQKIPLRGNTVIKYRAIFYYMRGHMTQCLKGAKRPAANDFWGNYERDVECSPFLASPVEVGGKRYEDGSAEI